MLKINTTDGLEVHMSKTTVKEIIINPNAETATIYTDRNAHEVSVETARRISEGLRDNNTERLTTAINNLTLMIRARVH